jgi:hypothetical protein
MTIMWGDAAATGACPVDANSIAAPPAIAMTPASATLAHRPHHELFCLMCRARCTIARSALLVCRSTDASSSGGRAQR